MNVPLLGDFGQIIQGKMSGIFMKNELDSAIEKFRREQRGISKKIEKQNKKTYRH
jgi:hypothetical protein